MPHLMESHRRQNTDDDDDDTRNRTLSLTDILPLADTDIACAMIGPTRGQNIPPASGQRRPMLMNDSRHRVDNRQPRHNTVDEAGVHHDPFAEHRGVSGRTHQQRSGLPIAGNVSFIDRLKSPTGLPHVRCPIVIQALSHVRTQRNRQPCPEATLAASSPHRATSPSNGTID